MSCAGLLGLAINIIYISTVYRQPNQTSYFITFIGIAILVVIFSIYIKNLKKEQKFTVTIMIILLHIVDTVMELSYFFLQHVNIYSRDTVLGYYFLFKFMLWLVNGIIIK
jgi:hypothetical protein